MNKFEMVYATADFVCHKCGIVLGQKDSPESWFWDYITPFMDDPEPWDARTKYLCGKCNGAVTEENRNEYIQEMKDFGDWKPLQSSEKEPDAE